MSFSSPYRKITTLFLFAFYFLNILGIAGCASKKTIETEYIPSKKIIEIKKDTPVYNTWDRWDESTSHALILGKKQIVEDVNLEMILADDPDDRVVEKIEKAKQWQTTSMILINVGLLAGLLSGTKQGQSDWGILGPAIGLVTVGVTILVLPDMYIRDAQSIHNGRLNQGPGISFNWRY